MRMLRRFQEPDAREVARWPTSIEEVRLWAGIAGGWPVGVSVFRRWHAEPDVNPYVLGDGDRLTGYGELWIDGAEQEVELARIIVNPAERGRGVGRRLVSFLLEQASFTGLPDAFVRVWFPGERGGPRLLSRRGVLAGIRTRARGVQPRAAGRLRLDALPFGLKPPALRWMMGMVYETEGT